MTIMFQQRVRILDSHQLLSQCLQMGEITDKISFWRDRPDSGKQRLPPKTFWPSKQQPSLSFSFASIAISDDDLEKS